MTTAIRSRHNGTKKGKLILFSGPSGVGKDTLLDILLRKDPTLQKSISITTRLKRENEHDGVDYYFITPDDFEAMLDSGDVLEFAKYGKNLYGTPKNRLTNGCPRVKRLF